MKATLCVVLAVLTSVAPGLSQPRFALPMTVTDGVDSVTLYFGILPGGHYCLDEADTIDGHGEFYLPPGPPSGVFDARTLRMACPDGGSLCDFRPYRSGSQRDTFRIKAQIGVGTTLRIRWHAGLSGHFTQLTLRYFDQNLGQNVNVNMLEDTVVDITAAGDPAVVNIYSFGPTSVAHHYYPLALGNEWFYRMVGRPPGDSTIDSSVRVVGDTLLSNGHRYFVLSQNDIMGSRYVRTDSTSVYYLGPYTGQEQRVFRLDGLVGDTVHISWGPYAIVRLSGVDTLSILGRQLRTITFVIDGLQYAVMGFCGRFGPMTEWRYNDPPPPWPDWGRELVGCVIDGVRYGRTLDIAEPARTAGTFHLFQNYPNPFNPTTMIRYALPHASFVVLTVYNMLGQEIARLVNEQQQVGYHEVMFRGDGLASGMYIYRLEASGFVSVKKLLLLR